jgi:hypothetical protein
MLVSLARGRPSPELLPLVALGLMPDALIARSVGRVHPFRDNALRLRSARGLQVSLAVTDVVVAVLNGSRRIFDEGFLALLSFEKGQAGQLLALEKQEIEGEVHELSRVADTT